MLCRLFELYAKFKQVLNAGFADGSLLKIHVSQQSKKEKKKKKKESDIHNKSGIKTCGVGTPVCVRVRVYICRQHPPNRGSPLPLKLEEPFLGSQQL